jgi:hypothetical protein
MKTVNLVVAGALSFSFGIFPAAFADTGTRIDLTFQGMNLTRFGGSIADVLFSFHIPQDAVDRSPESPLVSQFAADVDIAIGGQTYSTFGFIQLGLPRPDLVHPYITTMVLTVAYPGEYFPGQSLNTQLSGMELALYDGNSQMITSEAPGELASDFASKVASFRFSQRVGGWAAGRGDFHDYTNDSIGTAHFLSRVTPIAQPIPDPVTPPIPEPETYAMMLVGLGLVGLAARRRNRQAAA